MALRLKSIVNKTVIITYNIVKSRNTYKFFGSVSSAVVAGIAIIFITKNFSSDQTIFNSEEIIVSPLIGLNYFTLQPIIDYQRCYVTLFSVLRISNVSDETIALSDIYYSIPIRENNQVRELNNIINSGLYFYKNISDLEIDASTESVELSDFVTVDMIKFVEPHSSTLMRGRYDIYLDDIDGDKQRACMQLDNMDDLKLLLKMIMLPDEDVEKFKETATFPVLSQYLIEFNARVNGTAYKKEMHVPF